MYTSELQQRPSYGLYSAQRVLASNTS